MFGTKTNLIWLLVVLLSVIIGIGMWQNLQMGSILPLRVIAIKGRFAHINKAELKDKLAPLVENGSFNVDLQAVQNQLTMMPWIEKASVKRVWPDSLVIKITEKKPLARWFDKYLVTSEGKLFLPNSIDSSLHLPLLRGPNGMHQEVLTQFKQMNTMLEPLSLNVKELELTEPGAWRLWINNEMRLELGREQPLVRLRRFIRAYPTMFAQVPNGGVQYVDLRYVNGMAVRWQDH